MMSDEDGSNSGVNKSDTYEAIHPWKPWRRDAYAAKMKLPVWNDAKELCIINNSHTMNIVKQRQPIICPLARPRLCRHHFILLNYSFCMYGWHKMGRMALIMFPLCLLPAQFFLLLWQRKEKKNNSIV